MKRRPWSIILLAWLHVLAPFGNILFNSWRADRSPLETWHFWFYVLPMPLFFTYIIVPVLAGLLIYNCKRWSYWAYVTCLIFIFFSNIYGFWTNANVSNLVALIGVLVLDVVVVAYFVSPSVRQVYFDPRLRWWEAAPRYIFNEPAQMNEQSAAIKNISTGGVMVESTANFQEGETVKLHWVHDQTPYATQGKVAYRKTQEGIFFYGIQFQNLGDMKKPLNGLIKYLKKNGQMIQDRMPGPEDSFLTWLKKLFFRQEGFFPKKR